MAKRNTPSRRSGKRPPSGRPNKDYEKYKEKRKKGKKESKKREREKRKRERQKIPMPDIRPEVIEMFRNPNNWTHYEKDPRLADDVEEYISRAISKFGEDAFAYGLQQAEEAGVMDIVQEHAYHYNFNTVIVDIADYIVKAYIELENIKNANNIQEKVDYIQEVAQDIDDELAQREGGWADFDDEDETVFNMFGGQ